MSTWEKEDSFKLEFDATNYAQSRFIWFSQFLFLQD